MVSSPNLKVVTGGAEAGRVIDIRKLSLVFQAADNPVLALSDIDLAIRPGEFVSFIGPSGCGKTTLLRVIANLVDPTAGAITVNGMTPEQARLKRAYGYVFQAPALYPWRTVRRNVMLPLEIMGLPAARPLDVRETPAFLDIAHRVRVALRAGHSYDD